MTLLQRIDAFVQLGVYLKERNSDLKQIVEQSLQHNSWYTNESINQAIDGIVLLLENNKIEKWVSNYDLESSTTKNIGVIMAGNIPLVGFHDLICVLISGHRLVAKLSTHDAQLIPHLAQKLIEFNADFRNNISFVDKLDNIDAIIATGSNNTARYFEHYFGKYPNIIRKNRTSIAILTGSETKEDFKLLGKDIFQYYGLGCRNISKLYVPNNYNFTPFFEGIEEFSKTINHHKYQNNYDYNKSIYLVNIVPHLDNGFLLVTKNDAMVSPISVLFYETYSAMEELSDTLLKKGDVIQCVCKKNGQPDNTIAFGKAQQPELSDYADNVDTLQFLRTLN